MTDSNETLHGRKSLQDFSPPAGVVRLQEKIEAARARIEFLSSEIRTYKKKQAFSLAAASWALPELQEAALWCAYWELEIAAEDIGAAFDIRPHLIAARVAPFFVEVSCFDCQKTWMVKILSRTELSEKRRRAFLRCDECFDRYEEDITSDRIDDEQASRITALAMMPYKQYLETPEWAARRKAELRHAGYRCRLCNADAPLNVHHRTYERRGCEKQADLIALCENCHTQFHEKLSLAGGASQ